MKTYCIRVPRASFTESDALKATVWDIHEPSLFTEMLDELHESLDEMFSLEIYSNRQNMHFCYTANGHVSAMFQSAAYSINNDFQIEEIEDFTHNYNENDLIAGVDIFPGRDPIYPFVDWKLLTYDTGAPLGAVLSRLRTEDRAIIQIVCQPIPDNARLHFEFQMRRAIDRLKQPLRTKYWFKKGVRGEVLKAIAEKVERKFCLVNIRVAVISPGVGATSEEDQAADRVYATLTNNQDLLRHIKAIYGGMAAMNTLDMNNYRLGKVKFGPAALIPFQDRLLKRPFLHSNQEIASTFHPAPLGSHVTTILSLKDSPPKILPSDVDDPQVCFFGQTDYRDHVVPFGVLREDRRRHMYVVGKSGVGKSKLLELLIRNDIDDGFGCAVLDPHGDLVDDVLKNIPPDRVKDVVLFNPSDLDFPPSFNPLEDVPEEIRARVAIGFVEIFKKLFAGTWTERLEHLLRSTILALLSSKGTTILSIVGMLCDNEYRVAVGKNISDQVLREFWLEEYNEWAEAYAHEAIVPLIDKICHFISTNMVRNIVGQPINRFDFEHIMNNRKILLMKVSTGLLGEENASLLGAMVVSKIYQAAMGRANIPVDQREDFYFYVDEFHQFATSSFTEILSESRKYNLNLTVANQYLQQLPDDIQKAILGNVGNLLTFRVGGGDADVIASELRSDFSAPDILNLAHRDFYVRMIINGEAQKAFSGRTLEMIYPEKDCVQQCIDYSRKHYCLPVEKVAKIVDEATQASAVSN